MNKNLNFVLLQSGLLKLGSQNDMVKNAIYGNLLRTLPRLVSTFFKSKPHQSLWRSTKKFFGAPENVRKTQASRAYAAAKADTANEWNALNPWARRAVKYPAQIAAGYGLGLPFGLPGWLGFGVGNEKDKLKAGQEGAARALEGVQKQLAEARGAYDQSGILGRLAGGFTAAFNPDKIFSPIDSELTRHIETLRGIKPKAPSMPAAQQPQV